MDPLDPKDFPEKATLASIQYPIVILIGAIVAMLWGGYKIAEASYAANAQRVIGVRLNLPRFDAHSLTGTIVPEESEDEQENQRNL